MNWRRAAMAFVPGFLIGLALAFVTRPANTIASNSATNPVAADMPVDKTSSVPMTWKVATRKTPLQADLSPTDPRYDAALLLDESKGLHALMRFLPMSHAIHGLRRCLNDAIWQRSRGCRSW
jgi:hypothetical protein